MIPILLLMLVRPAVTARIDRQIAALDDIVMREDVTRYLSERGKTEKIDEFDASVEAPHGVESVADLRRNGRPYSAPTQIPGAFSFGDFSAVLRVSRDALEDPSARLESLDGTLAATFRYSARDARWFVGVGSNIRWLDFRGEMRMSAETGEVLWISWISEPVQREGIRQIRRVVTFAPARVGDEMYVLPESAEYCVIHKDGRAERNTIRFHDPARYGSLVSVNYEW